MLIWARPHCMPFISVCKACSCNRFWDTCSPEQSDSLKGRFHTCLFREINIERLAAPEDSQPLNILSTIKVPDLALSNSEHLGTTYWTCTLSRRFAILHCDRSGIPHLPFSAALHAVGLHSITSFLCRHNKPFSAQCQ